MLNINLVELLERNYVIILVTTANTEEAEKIAQILLEEKLIACANVISKITSFFNWAEKINKTEECLLIMKSSKELFSELVKRVKCLHSYQVPEIVSLPIVEGSVDYLEWMAKSLR